MEKAPEAFRTISEVADELDVPQHVLRFWETRFSQIKPMKRGGGRRYYRPNDVDLLKGIRQLLYGQGYTIRGVQRILREQGMPHVAGIGRGEVAPQTVPEEEIAASPVVRRHPDPVREAAEPMEAPEPPSSGSAVGALSRAQAEELKLALTDLAAARRLLTSKADTE